MVLSDVEIKEAKKQLLEQVKDLPLDQKNQAIEQIEGMSSEAIESMIEQQRSQQKVFRFIIEGKIPATVVRENDELLAVMEIRPLSKGHVLIIPKVEVLRKEDLPSGVVSCAKDIAEKIRTNLGAKKVKVAIEQKFGEIVVEVVPEYDVPVPEADRKEADKDELLKLRDEIVKEVIKVETKKEIIKQSNKEEKKSEVLKLSRRIP